MGLIGPDGRPIAEDVKVLQISAKNDADAIAELTVQLAAADGHKFVRLSDALEGDTFVALDADTVERYHDLAVRILAMAEIRRRALWGPAAQEVMQRLVDQKLATFEAAPGTPPPH